MDENLHDIEDLFHSALNDNEETPSQNVWEAVDKRLDKDNIVSIKRKYTDLKRIAVLLVLLLTSFALYDVYKINTSGNLNGFAKNNGNINLQNKKPGKAVDKTLNKQAEKNPGITTGTNNTTGSDKQKIAFSNSDSSNKKRTDKENTTQVNTYPLQEQNISEVTGLEKDISKKQACHKYGQNKKITVSTVYKLKIKSAGAAEDEQLLVQNNNEPLDTQTQPLRKVKNVSIENIKLQRKDFIDPQKKLQSITAAKIKIPDINKAAVAKNVKGKQSKSSGFYITPFFSPDIAWYRLKDDNIGTQPDNANEIEKEENHEFSYTFGALVDYAINKHWGLQSGLTLSNINITVQPKTIYAQPDNSGNIKFRINSSSGYGYVLPSYIIDPSIGDSLYAFTTTHSLQYVGIPLAVTYRVAKGKFTFNAMTGLSVNILTSAKLETSIENGFSDSYETINKLQGLQKIYFSGTAGIGADYKLTNKTAITFAPVIRFALNSINKDAAVKSYPMSLGLAVGLKIGL